MAEFIVARYPRRRIVLVDGQRAGETNRILRISEDPGFFDIELDGDKNYAPPSYDGAEVSGTGVIAPAVFVFRPVWAPDWEPGQDIPEAGDE